MMMEVIHDRSLIICCMCFLLGVTVTFATESDSNATFVKDVDGLTLLNMGKRFNKPLLTLIGMAMTNLHPCGQWTTWSSCTAVRSDYIGIRKRTRSCKGGESLKDLLKVRTESDFTICQGSCRIDYNETANGYCMKLYTEKSNQEQAEKQCKDDGGHLINIDSDLKYEDVKDILQGTSYAYIAGRRKDVNSSWVGSDGSTLEYIKWESGQPDNTPNQLCLLLDKKYLWYDAVCTGLWYFICEI